jgi:phosphoenolpyruvate carboxykinase (GTP)
VPASINVEGLDLECKLEDMLSVDKKFWIKEANEIKDYFDEYVNDSMPKEINDEVNHLIHRVNEMD